MSTSQIKGNRGISRVITKLEAALNSGNFYEAHQMYRTLYFRYLSQKKYDELLEMLYKGSISLLNFDQLSSGADLVLLIIDVLEESKPECYDNWITKIGVLLSKIGPNVIERETIIVRAIRWSSEASKNKMGHPVMHKLIAQIMWAEGNLEQARHHFLVSKDGAGCGQMLIELSQKKGFVCETDLFIAQVVFQQLCIKETTTALKTFETYTKFHPKIATSEPPFNMPLLNFVFYLLKSIETRKLQLFKTLCDLYKPSLDRDPSYEKYLQKVGIIFFDAPPPQPQPTGGLFGGLIAQLFQGLDGGDDQPRTSSMGPRETNIDVQELD